MKNLRDAPAVVIGFAYILLSLPTLIISLPTLLSTAGVPNTYNFGFDFTNPLSSIISLISQIDKLALALPLVLLIVTLIICIIFRARKVNSLIVYYFVSIILSILGIINIFISAPSAGTIYYENPNSPINLFYSNYPQVTIQNIFTVISAIATITFLLTVLYFLSRYKNLGKTAEVPVEKSVSITEVLKKQS